MSDDFDAFEDEVVSRDTDEAIKRHRLFEQDGLRQMLATYQGRAFIWSLLVKCGVYRISFAGELTQQTSFNEGQRNVGLYLMQECLTENDEMYNLMRREGMEREKELQRGNENDG